MNITIGENIKRLRRERNITQEQLAEVLNISTAAVSKWERGETYPDITLLFPLAQYFSVSIDDLMGYDAEKEAAEVKAIIDKMCEIRSRPESERLAFAKDAYLAHPNNYQLAVLYLVRLGGDLADNDPALLIERKNEISALCDKIIDGCNDIDYCLQAWNFRAKLFWAEGKTDKAIEIYKEKFTNWYNAGEQKIEQLFPKNTEEFRKQLVDNMLELNDFSMNKKVKDIWYCHGYTLKEKAKKGLELTRAIKRFADEIGDKRFYVVWAATLSDHVWKMAGFGVPADDLAPALDELFEAKHACDELYLNGTKFYEGYWLIGKMLKTSLGFWGSASDERHKRVFENPACRAVIDKWKKIAET